MISETLSQLKYLRLNRSASLWFSLVSISAVPFGDLSPNDDFFDVAAELSLGAIATAGFWLVVLPGVGVLDRLIRPGWGRQAVLASLIVLGALVRGFLMYALSDTFGFESVAGLSQRLANSVSTTVLWLLIFTMFFDAAKSFQRRYSKVFDRAAISLAASVPGSEVAKILGDIQDDLRQIGSAAIDETRVKMEMERIAAALEQEVLTKIKSQSGELWRVSAQQVPKLRVAPLFRMALANLNYPIALVLTAFGTTSLLNIASTVGLESAAWRVAVALLLVAGVDYVYRRVLRPRLKRQLLANVGFLLFVGAIVQLPLGLVGYIFESSSAPVVFVLFAMISAPLLMILLSVLQLAKFSRQQLIDDLIESSKVLPATAPDGSTSPSTLASFLHNSLQSELQSIILALKKVSTEESGVEIGKASLERLRLISNRSLDEQFAEFNNVPLDHLHQVIVGWRGILDIKLDWPESHQATSAKLPTVVQIIEEVASNSAVHGGATAMKVKVRERNSVFTIEIRNNAIELSMLKAEGQGSNWLQNFAVSESENSANSTQFTQTFLV